jgi:hypothetical protein
MGRRAASFRLAGKAQRLSRRTRSRLRRETQTQQLLIFGSASSVRPKGLPTRAQLT